MILKYLTILIVKLYSKMVYKCNNSKLLIVIVPNNKIINKICKNLKNKQNYLAELEIKYKIIEN